MTARRPESENDSWHIWMYFTWLDDYRQSLRMQATEETNLQNWGFNIWCLVLAWRRLAVRALSLLEKCSGTMPEHGIPVCCESDCKWKTFVINGELFSRIVNTEVINDQVIPIFCGNIPPLNVFSASYGCDRREGACACIEVAMAAAEGVTAGAEVEVRTPDSGYSSVSSPPSSR